MNPEHEHQLVQATLLVARELCGIREQLHAANNNNAILHRLAEMEKRIMEAIDKFAESVNASFETLGAAAESLGTAVEATNTAIVGVTSDVEFIKTELKKLQDSQGPWTEKDQSTLDGIQARANTIATNVAALSTTMTAVAAAAAALDAATTTPPVPPVE